MLRGAAPDVWMLYGATIVTGFGVAVMQPSMPPLVRAWLPDRIGFATAVYSNGLIIGEILPVALMIPVVLPLLGGSWRLGFVAWGVPCLAIAAALYALAPRPAAAPLDSALPRKWWPDWKSSLLWRLGLMLGGVNASYFSTNAFLPDYLSQLGRADLIGPALTALNVGQLPASFLLLALVGRVEKRSATYLIFGVLTLAAALGIIFGKGLAIVAAAALVGFAASAVLILMLALPPLLERARGRAADGRGHVHHQLFLRGDRADRQRPRLGRHRRAGGRVRADCGRRAPHHRPRPHASPPKPGRCAGVIDRLTSAARC